MDHNSSNAHSQHTQSVVTIVLTKTCGFISTESKYSTIISQMHVFLVLDYTTPIDGFHTLV